MEASISVESLSSLSSWPCPFVLHIVQSVLSPHLQYKEAVPENSLFNSHCSLEIMINSENADLGAFCIYFWFVLDPYCFTLSPDFCTHFHAFCIFFYSVPTHPSSFKITFTPIIFWKSILPFLSSIMFLSGFFVLHIPTHFQPTFQLLDCHHCQTIPSPSSCPQDVVLFF